jgi:hypothetical protein
MLDQCQNMHTERMLLAEYDGYMVVAGLRGQHTQQNTPTVVSSQQPSGAACIAAASGATACQQCR